MIVGLQPYLGVRSTPRYDGRVRVNPKITPQPPTKTHLVRFGVFVGRGVSLGLTRTRRRVGCRVTTLIVRFHEQYFTITCCHCCAINIYHKIENNNYCFALLFIIIIIIIIIVIVIPPSQGSVRTNRRSGPCNTRCIYQKLHEKTSW